MATTNVSATSVKNNNVIEDFDWSEYENSPEIKEADKKLKLEQLEDEIKFYNSRISKKKKDISRLERSLRVAERELKAVKEAQRVERIKALLEANKGKRVIIEDNLPCEELCSALAEDIKVSFQYDTWSLTCLKEHWSLSMSVVTRVYVEVEI